MQLSHSFAIALLHAKPTRHVDRISPSFAKTYWWSIAQSLHAPPPRCCFRHHLCRRRLFLVFYATLLRTHNSMPTRMPRIGVLSRATFAIVSSGYRSMSRKMMMKNRKVRNDGARLCVALVPRVLLPPSAQRLAWHLPTMAAQR
jgi:hypothetical protein